MQSIDNEIIFYVFASIALLASSMVVLAKNPVRAVLSLILTFISTACTWLILDAEFLAITLILVYVGAVMVLFLFVVMMLDIDFASLKSQFTRWLPLGICSVLAIVSLFITIINRDMFVFTEHGNIDVSNVEKLGEYIFTKYILQFEIAGILLLVAVIAAIGLIYRGPHDRKQQKISDQIKVKPADRVYLVDGD